MLRATLIIPREMQIGEVQRRINILLQNSKREKR
jgi:hypothetical protein